MPNVRNRDDEVFREGAGPVDSHSAGFVAEMPATGEAIAADAADYVTLSRNDVPNLEVMYIAADSLNGSDELMPNRHRDRYGLLSPLVP